MMERYRVVNSRLARALGVLARGDLDEGARVRRPGVLAMRVSRLLSGWPRPLRVLEMYQLLLPLGA